MLDRLDRVVRVGDVVSVPWYDHGTTLRVVDIGNNVIFVKKCCRGRKIFPICFPQHSLFCRGDFMIVNR